MGGGGDRVEVSPTFLSLTFAAHSCGQIVILIMSGRFVNRNVSKVGRKKTVEEKRVYTSTLLVYRIGHPMQLRTSTWARRSHKILTTSPSKKGFDPNRYAFQNTAGVYVYHHICMPVLSANTDINHFSIDACLHPISKALDKGGLGGA